MKQLLQEPQEIALAGSLDRATALRFLREWANAPNGDFSRLAGRFPHFQIPSPAPPPSAFRGFAEWTRDLQDWWRKPRARERVYGLAWLLSSAVSAARNYDYPFADPIIAVLFEAIPIADRLAVCANPECPAPLFIKQRKNQAQCSMECAAWAQRSWKREWWKAHGKQWRASRRKRRSAGRRGERGIGKLQKGGDTQ